MADESKYPTRLAPYGLRIPPELKARIQASAEANSRSLHSEIIHTLEEAYPAPASLTKEQMIEFLDLVEKLAAKRGDMDTSTMSRLSDVIAETRIRVADGDLSARDLLDAVIPVVPGAFLTIGGQRVLEGPPDTQKKGRSED